jgi:hypothetical protein
MLLTKEYLLYLTLPYNPMIKRIIILALFLPLFTITQKESLTYDQTQDIEFAKQYKNNTAICSGFFFISILNIS